MRFHVVQSSRAKRDFQRIYDYIFQSSIRGADAWAEAFYGKFRRLEQFAQANSIAPEADWYDGEIRQMLFRTKSGLTYRAVYLVDGGTVTLLAIRGPGQDLMSADEMDEID